MTQTDPLKKVVKEWAEQTATDARRGTWRDPRRESLTLGEWYDRWQRTRVVEAETRRADDTSWRLHLREHFADRPLRDITRSEVGGWVAARERDGIGPAAIGKALAHLKATLEAATLDGHLEANPARRVKPPTAPPKLPEWHTQREVEAIAGALRKAGRESDAVLVELMCWVGPRWGEAVALRGDDVDWLRRTVRIDHTLTQHGKDKPYPKNSTSIREVPAPAWLVKRLGALLVGRPADARIFVTKRGRDLNAANWREDLRVVLEEAGLPHTHPHKFRHTAASWLVQAGVPLYDVKTQLGHGSIKTTERYAHLAPDVSNPVTAAWKRLEAPRAAPSLRRARRQG
ncbi:tyrosine-type recombinase/integrase [Isoptericola variabilis]|uniref:tyrosine-type recombinase/integrase n=1 Tax=Isoptericola variabilis TaxID=139208 RepID=UPI003D23AA4E